jgi:anaerobic sulfite reductase subunit B
MKKKKKVVKKKALKKKVIKRVSKKKVTKPKPLRKKSSKPKTLKKKTDKKIIKKKSAKSKTLKKKSDKQITKKKSAKPKTLKKKSDKQIIKKKSSKPKTLKKKSDKKIIKKKSSKPKTLKKKVDKKIIKKKSAKSKTLKKKVDKKITKKRKYIRINPTKKRIDKTQKILSTISIIKKAEKEHVDVNNNYIPQSVKITKANLETNDTKLFHIPIKEPYAPGQFYQVSVLGIGECPISVCSHSNSYLELCIRNVGTVTKSLFKLNKNDEILIRGPYGKGYPVKDFEGKDVIIIGGGTGVAPLRGVIDYMSNNKKFFENARMFFGFRTFEDILFEKDIRIWSKNFDVNLTVDKKTPGYKGDVGLITDLLDKKKLEFSANSVVLVCGPPIMIKFVIKKLEEKGFRRDQIWLSYERMMKCGIGKCGHCQAGNKYCCQDGPVFNYADVERLKE